MHLFFLSGIFVLNHFPQVFETKGEPRAPTTRGEVAAQERLRIIGQAKGNFVQNRNPVRAK
jgi:hypothetical protein